MIDLRIKLKASLESRAASAKFYPLSPFLPISHFHRGERKLAHEPKAFCACHSFIGMIKSLGPHFYIMIHSSIQLHNSVPMQFVINVPSVIVRVSAALECCHLYLSQWYYTCVDLKLLNGDRSSVN